MIKNYFKIAWRNLWRHKQMTIINILGLGIGMAATVLIVLWVQNELNFDKYQPDAKNIYRITADVKISPTETWIWKLRNMYWAIMRLKRSRRGEPGPHLSYVLFRPYPSLQRKHLAEKKAAYVDGQWFKMFHYDFIEGSPQAFLKNPFSLIISASTAKKYFGEQDALGKILRIDTVNYQVQAVVKDAPANSSFQYNVLMPIVAQMADAATKKNALQWG